MNREKLLKLWDSIKPLLQKRRTIVITAMVTLVVMAVILVACVGKAAQSAVQSVQTTPVIAARNVIAEGHLEPVTSTWLSFQTAGRVEAILVKEGDAITQGQALVRLEGSDRAEAELTAAKSVLFVANQNLDDAKKSDAAKSAAELALASARHEYDNALSDYWNRNETAGTADEISLYENKVIVAQDKVNKLQDRVDDMGEMKDDDPVKAQAIANLDAAKIDLKNLTDIRDALRDTPDQVDVSILQAKLDVAKADLEDAQREYDRLKDGPTQAALAAVQAAADSAQAAADQAQWAYDQLVLKAPYDGTFVRCDLTVGQFVTIGVPAALVADFSTWRIETDDLDENEVTRIDTTRPVTITADALPGREFSGTIDSVSQYYTDDNGDVLYTVKIKLENTEPQLRWGMTMQVEFQNLVQQ